MPKALLQVEDLTVRYSSSTTPALQEITFELKQGETLAVIGESGAGKTTLARTILGLQPASAAVEGRVQLDGRDLSEARASALQRIRGAQMCMIPQEPEWALNPVVRAREHVEEVLRAHIPMRKRERRAKAEAALAAAGLDRNLGTAYPHQLSGGQRQRVAIAQAIVCGPALVIADEPTSALDKVLEAEIMALLKELAGTLKLALLLITHDPLLVRSLADRVLVLRQGRLVETGSVQRTFDSPRDQYTAALIHSVAPLPAAEPELGALPDNTPRPPAIIEVAEVSKTYFTGRFNFAGETVRALDAVSLRILGGSTLALVGRSGSGKSTLARCLALLEQPDTGEIRFRGESTRGRPRIELGRIRRKIQLVWQHSALALNPRYTAATIVAEPLLVARLVKRSDARARALDMMEKLGLASDLASRSPFDLSGGQRQRLALARALIIHPDVLILDEAFAGLDLPLENEIARILLKLKAALSLACIFITHDLRRAASLADEIAVMHEGKIVEQGDPGTLFRRPKHEATRRLVDATLAFDRMSWGVGAGGN